MELAITVTAADSGDELRSLYRWLADDDGLRGRVRLVDGPPAPGTLGSVPELIAVVLTQGGVGAAAAGAVVAWLRHRTKDIVCKVKRSDGSSVELTAKRVRTADLPALQELVTDVAKQLEPPPDAG